MTNNYYNEVLKKIEDLMNKQEYIKVKDIINEELSVAYVPVDFENKLYAYLDKIKDAVPEYKNNKVLNDEEIVEYLHSDSDKQLIAVSQLFQKNLRDYIDIIEDYLISDGFINAKVLLVDSLIRQEISTEIKMVNNGVEYSFIPKYQLPIDQTDAYHKCVKILFEHYLKEPSKYQLSIQLLYKELLLMLPISLEIEEVDNLCNKIIDYIEKAFS